MIPGPKPSWVVTRTTATNARFGRTPAISMTGERPAWTIPTTTARRTLVYEMVQFPRRGAGGRDGLPVLRRESIPMPHDPS
jgi:hypothetical protein